MERGRPRQFDEQQALEAAMQVFWRNGYRGASMTELTTAMGINKPSLYSAFGSKEQLYIKALEHYGTTRAAAHTEVLRTDMPLREALAAFFKSALQRNCDKAQPGGCYVVNALPDCSAEGTPQIVAEATQAAFRASHTLLKDRLLRARREGELPDDADPAALAAYFSAVLTGMSVMARNGTSRQALSAVADQALASLPQP
jgi:TetR/AcrR family transcriptional regulator, copper-responsive repressor